MAFAVKLTGYSHADGQVLLELEAEWWDAYELMRDQRFVESINDGYSDYDAELSAAETREFHMQYKEKAGDVYADRLVELDQALSDHAAEYSHFHVQVFEWETGLG